MLCSCANDTSKRTNALIDEELGILLKKEGLVSKNSNVVLLNASKKSSESVYLVIEEKPNTWNAFVHSVSLKNDGIDKFQTINELCGKIITYKECKINGNSYWQFNVANHQGNGSTLFFDVKNKKVAYEIEGTVDSHFEGNSTLDMVNDMGFDLETVKGKDMRFSTIFIGNQLESYIKDVNDDGYDDLTFFGTQLLIEETNPMDYTNFKPYDELFVERIYYFNPKTDEFIADSLQK